MCLFHERVGRLLVHAADLGMQRDGELEPAAAEETLGVLLKYQDDIAKLRGEEIARRVAEARDAA